METAPRTPSWRMGAPTVARAHTEPRLGDKWNELLTPTTRRALKPRYKKPDPKTACRVSVPRTSLGRKIIGTGLMGGGSGQRAQGQGAAQEDSSLSDETACRDCGKPRSCAPSTVNFTVGKFLNKLKKKKKNSRHSGIH